MAPKSGIVAAVQREIASFADMPDDVLMELYQTTNRGAIALARIAERTQAEAQQKAQNYEGQKKEWSKDHGAGKPPEF